MTPKKEIIEAISINNICFLNFSSWVFLLSVYLSPLYYLLTTFFIDLKSSHFFKKRKPRLALSTHIFGIKVTFFPGNSPMRWKEM